MLSLNQHSLYVGVVDKPPPPPLIGEQVDDTPREDDLLGDV